MTLSNRSLTTVLQDGEKAKIYVQKVDGFSPGAQVSSFTVIGLLNISEMFLKWVYKSNA